MSSYLCTTADVAERMSEQGMSLHLDDLPASVSRCISRATSKILQKLLPIYNESDLLADATNGGPDGNGGMVKDLATDLAVCEVAKRRGNAMAQTWKDVCKEANELLESLRTDETQLPNVPTAAPQYPTWSNVNVQQRYIYKEVRVETQISDLPPSGASYPQAVDWFGVYYFEYAWWIIVGILTIGGTSLMI